MAEDLRDILMKLEVTPNKHVEAECTSLIEANPKVGTKDKLAELGTSFTMQSLDGARKTNYFSIDEFTFPLALIDSDDDEDAETRMKRDLHETVQQLAALQQTGADGKGMRPRLKPQFTSFMRGSSKSGPPKSYPADLEQITITKRFDVSSPTIFKLLKDSTTLHGASILKRRPMGDQSLRGFLRLDFTDVLITDLSWEDGDVIKEQFKFVCREAKVTYYMQQASTDTVKGQPMLKEIPATSWSVLSNLNK